jgi:hypothetical protein
MSSAVTSSINVPSSVGSLQQEEWPALSPITQTITTAITTDNDWELLPEASTSLLDEQQDTTVVVEKESVVRIVEPEEGLVKKTTFANKKILKHCQSSPDLRQYILEESDAESSSGGSLDQESSAVVIDNSDLTSLASSSIVMVPSPTVSTPWSTSKMSFSDILKKKSAHQHRTSETKVLDDQLQPKDHQHHTRIRKLRKPKFEVKPIKRCVKSSNDLRSLGQISELDDEGQILGETDAELFYNQKAQGKLGRMNGKKIRPDEAKRLEITMAKKTQQRQNQQR